MTLEIRKKIRENPQAVLLVIDYDRTLVNSQKEIMKETQNQLLLFQKNGGTIVLASGRPLSGLQKACEKLMLEQYNGYVVAENGANIYALQSNQLLASDLINNKKLERAFKILEGFPVEQGIYSKDKLLVTGITNDLGDEASSNMLGIELINSSSEFEASSKIIISDPQKNTHSYYKQINELLGDAFNVVKSSPRYIEITNKTVDKGCGISHIQSLLSNRINTIVGIGDSQNDYTMLEMCDYKIAMGNATDEIKMMCNITINTNEEDGIGEFLARMS